MGRTTQVVAAVCGVALLGAGAAIAAAITAPAKAELAADEIPIGSGLGRDWFLGGFSDLYPEGASGKEFWTITDRGPNLDGGVGLPHARSARRSIRCPGSLRRSSASG